MESVTLVFPHQLFKAHPALSRERPVYLIEEELFFNQYSFHKQKLVLHRASMKMYEQYLGQKQFSVHYIEARDKNSDIRQLLLLLASQGVKALHYADVADNWLEKRIRVSAGKALLKVIHYTTPNFLNTLTGVTNFFSKKKTYFQTDFYIWQRKERKILVDAYLKPQGGKWSYDAENRIKYPKRELPPSIALPAENVFVKEARAYVQQHFHENYGLVDGDLQKGNNGFYPVTFEEAEQWLENFLRTRLHKFGVYQDAMVGTENFLHHSVLTPILNIGLLDPLEVITKTMEAAAKYDVPLNSLEGFTRQVIGWREFIRIVYEREGSSQRTRNFWGFTRKIPAAFWTGTTGIVPVDTVIHKILKTAYSHHIERLMVMANFMLLCEFDPDEVYRWFMVMYIDSYDWVMVPNVYGMTQFADGGLMATKPYISGSNYLMKMGDFKKGPWQQVWDGLFWRFMHVNRDYFGKNARLRMLLNTFDKMPQEKRDSHILCAENFLASLDQQNL